MNDDPTAPGRGMRAGILAGLLCWAVILLALTGCTEADIRRTEAIVASAQQHLAQAVAIVEAAQTAVEQAQAVAAASGSAEAQAALAKAQAALHAAQTALPALQATVATAEQVAASARNGARWWEICLGIVSTAIATGLPLVSKLRGTSKIATAAIEAAEALKTATPGDDTDRVLEQIRNRQIASGARSGVQALRARMGLTS